MMRACTALKDAASFEAVAEEAAKLAREARQYATDDDLAGCSMGDIELYDAVISSCEHASKLGQPKNAAPATANGY